MADITQTNIAAIPGAAQAAKQLRDAVKDPKNFFSIIDQYKHNFRGQDGEALDMKAFTERLNGKFTTLSFGLEGCSAFCPLINQVLARTGKTHTNTLATVVINVTPGVTWDSQRGRDAFLQEMRAAGIRQDIIPLYVEKPEHVFALQTAFLGGANKKNPEIHSSAIHLYDTGGTRLREVLAADGQDAVDILSKTIERRLQPSQPAKTQIAR